MCNRREVIENCVDFRDVWGTGRGMSYPIGDRRTHGYFNQDMIRSPDISVINIIIDDKFT